jgi:hypothetical protein
VARMWVVQNEWAWSKPAAVTGAGTRMMHIGTCPSRRRAGLKPVVGCIVLGGPGQD